MIVKKLNLELPLDIIQRCSLLPKCFFFWKLHIFIRWWLHASYFLNPVTLKCMMIYFFNILLKKSVNGWSSRLRLDEVGRLQLTVASESIRTAHVIPSISHSHSLHNRSPTAGGFFHHNQPHYLYHLCMLLLRISTTTSIHQSTTPAVHPHVCV